MRYGKWQILQRTNLAASNWPWQVFFCPFSSGTISPLTLAAVSQFFAQFEGSVIAAGIISVLEDPMPLWPKAIYLMIWWHTVH